MAELRGTSPPPLPGPTTPTSPTTSSLDSPLVSTVSTPLTTPWTSRPSSPSDNTDPNEKAVLPLFHTNTPSESTLSTVQIVHHPHHPIPPPANFLPTLHSLISFILQTHQTLLTLSKTPLGLSPRPEINSVFSKLVKTCLPYYPEEIVDTVLEDEKVRMVLEGLRRMCGEGEYLLEREWAEGILAVDGGSREEVLNALQAFPYYQNYTDLTRLELSHILSFFPSLPTSSLQQQQSLTFLFLGSGPLPLTALQILLQHPNSKITCIDICPAAVRISNTLFERLGLQDRIQARVGNAFSLSSSSDSTDTDTDPRLEPGGRRGHHQNDSSSGSGYANYDVIYLAALIGSTPTEKHHLLRSILEKTSPGSVLITRSAAGLRRVLYAEIEVGEVVEELGGLWEDVREVRPWDGIVNSVVVGRRG